MTSPETGNAPKPDHNDARRPRRALRRGTLAALAVVAGGTAVLTACGHGGSGVAGAEKAAATSSPTSTPSSTPASTTATTQAREDAKAVDQAKQASAAKITITPKSGSTGVAVSKTAKVTVTGGKLTSVTMKAVSSGHTVAGTISADGRTWQPKASLGYGLQFKVSATAKDSQGRQATAQSTFATKAQSGSFVGYFTPEDGSTVGVGMPVSIKFSKAISTADRAAVQSGISVQSSSGQQVVGHWFSSTRLDLRPQSYWQAGSHVTLGLHLKGVKGAPGVYGVQNKTVSFDVGRSQVSTVDAQTHMMTVVRDGQVIRTVPVSAGGTGHTTYNGQMVIEEKDLSTRMNGATVGFTDSDGKGEYDIPDVPHAMRLSDSGTFIHGNYWSDKSVFGTTNTSHGCIGLSDTKGGKDDTTDAAWFYDNSLIGDVVTVVNSPDKTIQPDNGLNGWNMSWSQWVAGSAV